MMLTVKAKELLAGASIVDETGKELIARNRKSFLSGIGQCGSGSG